MSETRLYRHPVTNRVKKSANPVYMARAGFEAYDGEVEIDKANVATAALTAAELRELASEKGLPTSGTKADLQQRLAEDAANQTTDAEPDAGSDPSSDSAGGDQ